jgi:hypothetical protein
MSGNFGRVVVVDFEYETSGGGYHLQAGDLPRVLCMVAYVLDENLQHVRTVRLWRGEFGSAPPFDIGPDTLFVAYSAWAELTCFLTLGWEFPCHVFDLGGGVDPRRGREAPRQSAGLRQQQHRRRRDGGIARCRSATVGHPSPDRQAVHRSGGPARPTPCARVMRIGRPAPRWRMQLPRTQERIAGQREGN